MLVFSKSRRAHAALLIALLGLLLLPWNVCAAAPANDHFPGALVLVGVTAASNVGATAQPGEPKHAGSTAIASVWWTYTAMESSLLELETVGSDFDTRLAVYTGTSVDALTLVVENDNINARTLQSRVKFAAVAGTTYRIAVDGVGSQTGRVNLLVESAEHPANDDFTARQEIGNVTTFATTGTTIGATAEIGEPAHGGQNATSSLWWKWTAPATGIVRINTSGSTIDTILAVYTGSALETLTEIASNDDANPGVMSSAVEFIALAGTTYSIAVDSFEDAEGPIALQLNLGDPGTPPANDSFTSGTDLGSGLVASVTGTNANATAESGEPRHANSPAADSVWWHWTAPISGPVTIDTLGSNFDTVLAVYTGTSVGALTAVVSNDDAAAEISQSELHFTATAGVTYHIAVDGYAGAHGNIALTLILVPPQPANDHFANSINLGAASTAAGTGNNFAATAEIGEPSHAGEAAAASVWWRWTAPSTGDVEMDTTGSSFDTRLGIYTGNALSSLIAVTSNNDAATGVQTSKVRFAATAGTVYRIAVDGVADSRGVVALAIKPAPPLPPPVNDPFANRIDLGNGDNVSIISNNSRATAEANEPAHAGITATGSLWWVWTANANGVATISTAGSGIDTILAVYTGSSLNTLVPVAGNDEATPASGSSLVHFSVTAGTRYQIAVDGFAGVQGEISLGIQRRDFSADEGNDQFADRFELPNNATVTVTGSNFGASAQTGEPAHAGLPATESVWWEWIAPATGPVIISTATSDFDTRLAVYTGNTVNTLAVIAANDDTAGTAQSKVQFNAIAGTAYQIAVDGIDTAEGHIVLSIAPGTGPQIEENDAFALRTDLGNGREVTGTGSNLIASAEPQEPAHGGQPAARSLWWKWTAPLTGRFTLDFTQTSIAARAAVYTGSLLSTLTPVAGNTTAAEHVIEFDTVAGTTYSIAFDGFSGATGIIAFAIRPAQPLNDNFAQAIDLGNGQVVTAIGTNAAAGAETGEPMPTGHAPLESVWWKWTAPTTGQVTVETVGSDFDTVLGIYTGNAVNALALVAANDDLDAETPQSRASFPVIAGTTYFIVVDGFTTGTGQIHLTLAEGNGAQPPDNDAFADAFDLGTRELIAASADNLRATAQISEPAHAGNPATASVWFKWTAPRGAIVEVDTLGSNFDTVLAIHTGPSLGTLIPVASNDDADGGTLQSTLSFTATAGTVYYIAVDGMLGEQGSIKLGLNTDAPDNDDFTSRFDLGHGAEFHVTGSNVGATDEEDEQARAGIAARASVWWSWTAPVNMPVEINTLGSTFDTVLAVYTGSKLNTLTGIVSNNDIAGDTSSRVRFNAVAGTTYQIVVDTANGSTGTVLMQLLENRFGFPPANDNFSTAIELGSATTLAGTNVNATFETNEPAHAGQFAENTVWWKWTAIADGWLKVDTLGSTLDTVLAVYSGESLATLKSLAANDDATGQVLQSLVKLPVTAGVTYHIAIDGAGGVTAPLTGHVNFQAGSRSHAEYEWWAESRFPSGSAGHAPGGDLDGDALPNAIEYLLDLNPAEPNAGGLQITRSEGATILAYPRRKDVPAGTDIIEASTALQSWTVFEPTQVTVIENGGGQPDTVQITVPDSLGFRYFRLRVNIEP